MTQFNSSPFLNLDELNSIKESNSQIRLQQTYLFILQQCHEKIRHCNSVKKSKSCHYKPPLFLSGKPLYNYPDLIKFLLTQLQQNGLYTQYNTDEGIFICWDPRIINQKQYQQHLSSLISLPNEQPPQPNLDKPKPKAKSKIIKKPISASTLSTPKSEKVVNLIQIGNDEFPINF